MAAIICVKTSNIEVAGLAVLIGLLPQAKVTSQSARFGNFIRLKAFVLLTGMSRPFLGYLVQRHLEYSNIVTARQ